MSELTGKRILLGITGGIAAYKAAELVRLLCKAGAEVQVVMTEAAGEFITPMTLQALSGRPVRQGLFDQAHEAAMGHIELAAPVSNECRCVGDLVAGAEVQVAGGLCGPSTDGVGVGVGVEDS